MWSFPSQCQKLPGNAAAYVSVTSHRWFPRLCYSTKRKKKKHVTNQGIVRGPEHSCLTLVQSRKEARGKEWIKLAGKEEGEKSRRDRLCFRCSQVVGRMPDDVIYLQLGWWVLCMSPENLVFLLCVCESWALAYIFCPSARQPVYQSISHFLFFFWLVFWFCFFFF